jgi:proliferating cell nuclear antigen
VSTSTLAIRAGDVMNHLMVDLSVDGDSFETFTTDPGTLGVTVGRVREALSIGEPGDLAQFSLKAASGALEITINGISRTVDLEPVESLRHPPNIPPVEFPATAHVGQGDFEFALRAAKKAND